jgi:Bacterial type II and III secretion system protein.
VKRHLQITTGAARVRTIACEPRAWLMIALLALLSAGAAWAQSLETIELQHRTAEEIIPVLQPLLEPGGALSGQGYTLFVRTSAENLSQLRAALQQLDRKQRQLLVSVRRSTAQDMERERIEASGTVRNDRGAVSVNERPSSRSGVTVRGNDSRLSTSGSGISSVSVLEGSAAFISSATSVPVVTVVAGGVGRNRWGAASTQYRDLTNGFLVTPRVNGDTVVLDVEQRAEGLRDGAIKTQQLSTQVSARVGEWIQLGGIEDASSSTQSGIASRRYSTSSNSQSVWVKVDVQ